MAPPQLSEDEVEDLIYFSRAGDEQELSEMLSALVSKATGGDNVLALLASAKDGGKNTCLHMAAGNGHQGIVKYLLDQVQSQPKEARQVFLDDVNEYGNTALHWASMNGHLSVVKLLVDRGASQALANDKNYLPLDLASFSDKLDVVDYFLRSSGIWESENSKSTDAETGVNSSSVDGLSSAAAAIDIDDEASDDVEGNQK
ncbi:ankyrin repeat containing protein yar1 [Grosmannia clavigera kw1407]|uniref:Ankyrin repeat containing protein yar1 n=1 Tax=Grosmannia clavigera (strain kw1407 / UAMH 11150) TaxID=655863 RepID=F0XL16_GROCL|nr:ankyrin repeat containing protein yar1 [Grosmannia clavigera kw1407]EFX01807.1 ankyrin repeat containing protein yar1 [Grosmannia clavigera kw1407]